MSGGKKNLFLVSLEDNLLYTVMMACVCVYIVGVYGYVYLCVCVCVCDSLECMECGAITR